MLLFTFVVPAAACCTMLAINCVAVPCYSTDAEMIVAIWFIRWIVLRIGRNAAASDPWAAASQRSIRRSLAAL